MKHAIEVAKKDLLKRDPKVGKIILDNSAVILTLKGCVVVVWYKDPDNDHTCMRKVAQTEKPDSFPITWEELYPVLVD